MSRAVFVSDIHITSATDPKADLFLRFLDACARGHVREIFLVGDIFDLWIADRSYFTREYAEIVVKIRQLVHGGIKVYYFEGNHDLDLGRFWERDVGAKVFSHAHEFLINDLKIRVEHGDQMDPEDKGYLFLRWLLRTWPMIQLGRYLPNFIVRWIGRRASHSSRDYTTQIKTATDEQARAKIHSHAAKARSMSNFDILVSGHVHVAEDSLQVFNGASVRCINMGTWLKKPILLDISGSNVELKSVEEFIDE